jgi:AcrR family transcriptional regulator
MNKPTRPSADATRKKILKSARKVFVKNGFSGASIGQIAKTAQINKSLIYHHFEDKASLWKAVKYEIVEKTFKNYSYDFETSFGLKVFLEDFIKKRAQLFRKNPDMSRMILWQSLEPQEKALRWDDRRDLGEKLTQAIIELQKNGSLRDDISFEMVQVYLLYGVSSSYNAKHDALKDDTSWEGYLDILVDCVYRSLKA